MNRNFIFVLLVSFVSIIAPAQNLKVGPPAFFPSVWLAGRQLVKTIADGITNTQQIEEEAKKREISLSLLQQEKSPEVLWREHQAQERALRKQILEAGEESQRDLFTQLHEFVTELPELEPEHEDSSWLAFDSKPGVLEQPVASGSYAVPGMWMAPPKSSGEASSGSGGPAPQPEPLPANLRLDLPDPTIPWAMSERVFKSLAVLPNATYKKTKILPTDKEWRFVWRSFYHDKPTKLSLCPVFFFI